MNLLVVLQLQPFVNWLRALKSFMLRYTVYCFLRSLSTGNLRRAGHFGGAWSCAQVRLPSEAHVLHLVRSRRGGAASPILLSSCPIRRSQLERSQCSRDSRVRVRLLCCALVVCTVQVFGRMGAMQVAALLEARGVRRLQFVLDEGMMIAERVLPGLSRPVAMWAQSVPSRTRHSLASSASPDTRNPKHRYKYSLQSLSLPSPVPSPSFIRRLLSHPNSTRQQHSYSYCSTLLYYVLYEYWFVSTLAG